MESQPLDRDELAAWLRLTLTPGLGRAAARRLLAHAGSAQAVWAQPVQTLRALLSPAQTTALLTFSPVQQEALEVTWRWLQTPPAGLVHALLPLDDPRYPSSLLATEDPPLLLYVVGPAAAFHTGSPLFPAQRSLAVVGSRNPSAQGAIDAEAFAHALCAAGLCIVSGMARGIDAAAHEGALQVARAERAHGAGPATIAVWGTGLDQVYPRSHLGPVNAIAKPRR